MSEYNYYYIVFHTKSSTCLRCNIHTQRNEYYKNKIKENLEKNYYHIKYNNLIEPCGYVLYWQDR